MPWKRFWSHSCCWPSYWEGIAWALVRGQQSVDPGQSVNPVQSAVELEALRARYGPKHFSEREEEWIIRDFFQDRRGGTFLDVGANHYQDASKTFYLESQLGWSGLAVEPQTQFAAGYAAAQTANEVLSVLRLGYLESDSETLRAQPLLDGRVVQ